MSTRETALAVQELYGAMLGNDVDTAMTHLTDGVFIGVPGHEGAGRDHLVMLLRALHRGGFRSWSDDSADVLVSAHHGVVLDRWVAARDGAELDEHITVVAADRDANGRFGILSVYGYASHEVGRFFDAD